MATSTTPTPTVLVAVFTGTRHRWNPETRLAACGANPVGYPTRYERTVTCKRCLRKEARPVGWVAS